MPRKNSNSFLFQSKWSLPSLLFILVVYIGYDIYQEHAFPVIVNESSEIKLQACFTPTHNCQSRLIQKIDSAEKEILVMAYAFTDEDIAKALLKAHQRGIKVAIIADKTQRAHKHSQIPFLSFEGVPVYIDLPVAISHNKVMLIDERIVVTGSFNFTVAAQKRNAENLLLIESPALARQYKQNWITRRNASEILSTKSRDKPVGKSS